MEFAYDVVCCAWLPRMKNQLKWVCCNLKDFIFEKEKAKADLEEQCGDDVEAGGKNAAAAAKEGTGEKKEFKDPFMIYLYAILAFNSTLILAILNNANHISKITLVLNVVCFICAPIFITFLHSINPTRSFVLFTVLIMTLLLFSIGLSIVVDAWVHPRHPQAPPAPSAV